MRVKICGITNADDIAAAVMAGADALGFVFYPPSKRSISIEQAESLVAAVPPFVQTVALFVNAEKAFIEQLLASANFQLLQFHGEETADFCAQFDRPYIKSIPVKPDSSADSLAAMMQQYDSAQGFLLDTFKQDMPGGTGESFDWQLVPKSAKPLILAGGLNPSNVAEAIQQSQPYAVDVSGGVEQYPGKKSKDKLKAFIEQAKSTQIT